MAFSSHQQRMSTYSASAGSSLGPHSAFQLADIASKFSTAPGANPWGYGSAFGPVLAPPAIATYER